MNCEEVRGILLPVPAAHQINDKSLLRSPNKSMVPRDSFMNDDLTEPFKVAEKVYTLPRLNIPGAISGYSKNLGGP